jgi:hypothetical protein
MLSREASKALEIKRGPMKAALHVGETLEAAEIRLVDARHPAKRETLR